MMYRDASPSLQRELYYRTIEFSHVLLNAPRTVPPADEGPSMPSGPVSENATPVHFSSVGNFSNIFSALLLIFFSCFSGLSLLYDTISKTRLVPGCHRGSCDSMTILSVISSPSTATTASSRRSSGVLCTCGAFLPRWLTSCRAGNDRGGNLNVVGGFVHSFSPRRSHSQVFSGERMTLGLPLGGFVFLVVLPTLIVGSMFYYCWLLRKGSRD